MSAIPIAAGTRAKSIQCACTARRAITRTNGGHHTVRDPHSHPGAEEAKRMRHIHAVHEPACAAEGHVLVKAIGELELHSLVTRDKLLLEVLQEAERRARRLAITTRYAIVLVAAKAAPPTCDVDQCAGVGQGDCELPQRLRGCAAPGRQLLDANAPHVQHGRCHTEYALGLGRKRMRGQVAEDGKGEGDSRLTITLQQLSNLRVQLRSGRHGQ
mmetsp:Transcript_24651/g.62902  ORF Transcript_24651/g.62902 Transcript_24651/m.62902 type:complete len:214 (+) Transcript_24651:393-1034(+)